MPPERDKMLIAPKTETDVVKLFQEIRDRNKDENKNRRWPSISLASRILCKRGSLAQVGAGAPAIQVCLTPRFELPERAPRFEVGLSWTKYFVPSNMRCWVGLGHIETPRKESYNNNPKLNGRMRWRPP